MNEFAISIRTRDSKMRGDLFESEAVEFGDVKIIEEGFQITSNDPKNLRAFESIDVVNIAVATAASVPTALVSQWIWENLTKKSTVEVSINGVVLSGDKAEITKLVERIETKDTGTEDTST